MLVSWRQFAILFSGISTCLGLFCLLVMLVYPTNVKVEPTMTLPNPQVVMRQKLTATAPTIDQVVAVHPTVEPYPTRPTVAGAAPVASAPTPDFNFLTDATQSNIHIPNLGLTANIVEVPLRQGTWDVDGLQTQVGQLVLPVTNQQYAPIYAAHTSIAEGQPGPFYQIADLTVGSEILVTIAGFTETFALDHIEVVSSHQLQSLLIPNPNRIVLVTCTGWEPSTQSFQNRLVIHAVRTSMAS